MKKKVLAIAIASAMVVPSAFAAEDTSGMHFVSASEGFYASVRARYESGNDNANGADIQDASSRFGVRGTNDLGGGLEGFYQYEAGFDIDNGAGAVEGKKDGLKTRLGLVGLRGGFGQVQLGSFWTADYNWTHGSTDIANTASGFFNYTAQRAARSQAAIEYTSPDLNGFQAAVRFDLDNTGDTDNEFTVAPETEDKNDLDAWNIAAIYNIQGFTVAGSYGIVVDALPSAAFSEAAIVAAGSALTGANRVEVPISPATNSDAADDLDSWTARVGYAQDNWYVNAWYGEDSTSDLSTVISVGGANRTVSLSDTEIFSIGGGVTVDKVALYALYETREVSATAAGAGSITVEDNRGTVGVQYNIGSQSRVWVEYASRDLESSPSGDDSVNIGLRHDF